jgi:hypothetical protein
VSLAQLLETRTRLRREIAAGLTPAQKAFPIVLVAAAPDLEPPTVPFSLPIAGNAVEIAESAAAQEIEYRQI